MNTAAAGPMPRDIRVKRAERLLEITFDTGEVMRYQAEFLRVESPSAEVQGHSPAEKRIVPGCKYVGISDLETVGNYAIRITFDDGHDTGIYSWKYLYGLGRNQENIWQLYLAALERAGLKRDPFEP